LEEKKQGQTGSDVMAPRVAQYLCMRKRGNVADEPVSPPPFTNGIRPAMKNTGCYKRNLVTANGHLKPGK